MKKRAKIILLVPLVLIGSIITVLLITDFPTQSTPKFVEHDWIELDKITAIGKFHSTLGHGFGFLGNDRTEYSDKHYFYPSIEYYETYDNVSIFAPVDGIISNLMAEKSSTENKQIQLIPSQEPSFIFGFFHTIASVHIGQRVKAGDIIGYCDMRDSDATDISVFRWGKPVSWFDVITDEIFAQYQARGIVSKEQVKKTDEQAQASTDAGYSFDNHDPCDIVLLKNTPRIKCLPINPFNPENLTHYSYSPNGLINLNDEIDTIKVSTTQWFHLNYPSLLVSPASGVITEFSKDIVELANIQIKITVTDQLSFFLSIRNFTTSFSFEGGNEISAGVLLGNITSDVGFSLRPVEGNFQFSILEFLADPNLWIERGIENSSQYMLNNNEYVSFDTKGYGTEYNLDSPWFIEL